MTTIAKLDDLAARLDALEIELSTIPTIREARARAAATARIAHATSCARIADRGERNTALAALPDQCRRQLWDTLGGSAVPLILDAPTRAIREQWRAEVPSWIVGAQIVSHLVDLTPMVRVVAQPGRIMNRDPVPLTGDQLISLRRLNVGGVETSYGGGGHLYVPGYQYPTVYTTMAHAAITLIDPGYAGDCASGTLTVTPLTDAEVRAHLVSTWSADKHAYALAQQAVRAAK